MKKVLIISVLMVGSFAFEQTTTPMEKIVYAQEAQLWREAFMQTIEQMESQLQDAKQRFEQLDSQKDPKWLDQLK